MIRKGNQKEIKTKNSTTVTSNVGTESNYQSCLSTSSKILHVVAILFDWCLTDGFLRIKTIYRCISTYDTINFRPVVVTWPFYKFTRRKNTLYRRNLKIQRKYRSLSPTKTKQFLYFRLIWYLEEPCSSRRIFSFHVRYCW